MTTKVKLTRREEAYYDEDRRPFVCKQEFDKFFPGGLPESFTLEISNRKLKNAKSVWISRPITFLRWSVNYPTNDGLVQCFENAAEDLLNKFFPVEWNDTPKQLFFRIVA